MSWIDWLIVLIPLLLVAYIGFKTQKYVKGVADFLTAGRVAGRYVISVAQAEAGMGLISLVAMFEAYYNSGFAYSFWGGFAAPIYMVLSLVGFAIYRYRETRAMTLGQFFEMRYSRAFRIFAAILQSISGILNYAIFPAVGARFLVYFCDLPLQVDIGGWVFPTFALVMAIFLFAAVFVATMGGQITVMVTDCVQGILSYPMYAIIVGYVIFRFSWFNDMAPTLLNRPPGKSLLNPFDIASLRNFNLFYVMVGIFGSVLNRMAWSGTQGYNTAAKNAHEQKMGSVIGAWRSGFSIMMYVLLAVVAFMFLNNAKFSDGRDGSIACRKALAVKTLDDVANKPQFDTVRSEYKQYIETDKISPSLQKRIDGVLAKENEDPIDINDKSAVLQVGKTALKSVSKKDAQVFGTIFRQMRVPMALKYVLPIGFTGIFCALCVFMLISTDTTYLHSWGGILVQDIILPIRGKPFTPKQQLLLLRLMIASVAMFAFFFSYKFGQIDFIAMFFSITGAIWLGGAGPCILGGLYWKRGTSVGAFAALISGSTIAVTGIICQQNWVEHIYPWLVDTGTINIFTNIVEGASGPFEPFIQWRVTSKEFPINSMEIYAMNMLISISLYVGLSLLTCRKPHNMDRMLHRGKYRRDGQILPHKPKSIKAALLRIIGINEEYTRGDKILAWSVFCWSFGWIFLFSFVTIAIWNKISPWSNASWSNWFFINNVVIAGVVAVVSTIWFTIGSTWDLRNLFRRLKEKDTNVLDDGRVIDNVSADDIAQVEKIEHTTIPEAHIEEKILEDELKKEHDQDDLDNLHEHQGED
jgi:solute:Na+ symporter, SSS family